MTQVTPRPKTPTSKRGKATPDELANLAAVKRLPCCVCGKAGPSDGHHVKRFGEKKNHMRVIPLCKAHHQNGPDAIHNGRASWVAKFGTEESHVEATSNMLDVNIYRT